MTHTLPTSTLNGADDFATEAAADGNGITLGDIGHLVVMAIYENAGDIEKSIETLDRIAVTLVSCELGSEANEVFSSAIETLDNYRGFDIKKGFE